MFIIFHFLIKKSKNLSLVIYNSYLKQLATVNLEQKI